jgi:hypothetical protein
VTRQKVCLMGRLVTCFSVQQHLVPLLNGVSSGLDVWAWLSHRLLAQSSSTKRASVNAPADVRDDVGEEDGRGDR